MTMFLHLTTHSAYSLQEGLALPAELVQAAVEQGMPALGLTDHRLLTASVEFVNACKAAGVQPLLGLEIDLDSGLLALPASLPASRLHLLKPYPFSSSISQPSSPGTDEGKPDIKDQTTPTCYRS